MSPPWLLGIQAIPWIDSWKSLLKLGALHKEELAGEKTGLNHKIQHQAAEFMVKAQIRDLSLSNI